MEGAAFFQLRMLRPSTSTCSISKGKPGELSIALISSIDGRETSLENRLEISDLMTKPSNLSDDFIVFLLSLSITDTFNRQSLGGVSL
jgi:hypothetical protein